MAGSFMDAFRKAQAAKDSTEPGWSSPVQRSPEFDRIVALPRRQLDLTQVPDFTPLFARERGTLALRPLQNAALMEAQEADGLFGMLPVGSGKTLTCLLLPDVMQSCSAVYLLPVELKAQLQQRDIPFYSEHFQLPLDRLTIVTYHQLSEGMSADILDRLGPDLIIADEAHRLRHKEAARTRRFLRYFKDNPDTRFCALSGSFATRNLSDYAHLMELALRERAPIPRSYYDLRDWSEALDPPTMAAPRDPGVLYNLTPGATNARDAFRMRLVETPGVVAATEQAVTSSLYVEFYDNWQLNAAATKALQELEDTWSIGGLELTQATQKAAYARQLACGFYYRWKWPGGQPDLEWEEAYRGWNREVRSFLLRHSIPGLDSPALLEAACVRASAPGTASGTNALPWTLVSAWEDWARVKHRPVPPTEAVWLDDLVVRQARDWARWCPDEDGQRGIIWYMHDAVGEALRAAGFPVYGAGEDAGNATSPVIACSIQSQGTGKNLQRYSRALVLSPPANGATWEQLLGRLHRPGQVADEVWFCVAAHTEANADAIKQAISDARYVRETQGLPQKLLDATLLSPPR